MARLHNHCWGGPYPKEDAPPLGRFKGWLKKRGLLPVAKSRREYAPVEPRPLKRTA